VVFVEGDDMKLVRHLAEAVDASRLAREADVTVIPLRGFSNWDRIEPFMWLTGDLLERSVTVFAILDREYRPDSACRNVTQRLRHIGVQCHVWKRKELESYLLDPDVLARLSGASADWVASELRAVASAMETEVFARFSVERQRLAPHDHQVQAIEEAKREFEELWRHIGHRLWMCPPKEILSALNQRFGTAGYKTLAFPMIARAFTSVEVPGEIRNVLERIEDSLG
jgi:hypothetical protein